MLNASGYFVTGTDTNVGKTWSTLALMRTMQRQGRTVVAMKPVAAGCEWLDGGWRNADALMLQQHSSIPLEYEQINPYAFSQAVSPHVACDGKVVDMGVITELYRRLKSKADAVLVEGAGGWYSPLDRCLLNADLAIALNLPVIIVVGMRLGCLNHALLTVRAIQQSGLNCAGWFAVNLEPDMASFTENVQYLKQAVSVPLLGVLPFLDKFDVDVLAQAIEL